MIVRFLPRLTSLLLLAAACCWAAAPAQAASSGFDDAELAPMLAADRAADAERRALERLAARADDAGACLGLVLAGMAQGGGPRLDGWQPRIEGCAQAQPGSAWAQYALGLLLAEQAQRKGMLAGMRLAAPIRDAFAQALAADAGFFPARESLLMFYLIAPSIAGGGRDKAERLAAEIETRAPLQAQALRVRLALADKRWDEAERMLAHAGRALAGAGREPRELRESLLQSWQLLAYHYLRDEGAVDLARSRALFERIVRDFPERAEGPYGLGRALAEQGQHAQALVWFDKSRALAGALQLPIDYRAGLSLQAQGDKARARAAFERFVAAQPATTRQRRAMLDDAKKRLAELG